MPPKYASYIIHLVAQPPLDEQPSAMARTSIWDATLEALDAHPALWGFWGGQSTHYIEDYLTHRPEQFEKLANLVTAGRLELSAWYAQPDEQHRLETWIRSASLGIETARILGATSPFFPVTSAMLQTMPYLPAIAAGFGAKALLLQDATPDTAAFAQGADGTTLRLVSVASTSDFSAQRRDEMAAQASSKHLLLKIGGMPARWLQTLGELRQNFPADEPFFSNFAAFLKTFPPPTMPIDTPTRPPSVTVVATATEKRLSQSAEPLSVWAHYNDEMLKKPQRILRSLWRNYLHGDETVNQKIDELLALHDATAIDMRPKLVTYKNEQLEILALKLPDDGREGMILRVYYESDTAETVTIKFWRAFSQCDIVKLDETRTGAALSLEGGTSVSFTAHPHRILTLWLH